MINFLKCHKFSILILLSCCALYFSFGYDLIRSDFYKIIGLYAALFFLSWKLFELEKFNLKFLIFAAFLFRFTFLFSIPALSQDFYRFIWDGKLLLEGINPYLFSPEQVLQHHSIENNWKLISGMGRLSAGNHSNYPPLNQLFFALSGFLSNSVLGAIFVMRIFIIAADVGIFYFGRKLLKAMNLPENRIFWYLLNPFIIIELTGNLHFEGVLIFFLIWSLYLLKKKKWFGSSILMACAVSIKLIPLLFIPLLFRKLGLKKTVLYCAIVAIINLLFFLPFISMAMLQSYAETTALWFQNFEFNASFYYLIRWIGYQIEGYNIIGIAGKVLAIMIFVFVLILSYFQRNKTMSGLMTSMLFAISFYYFMATTVHPWYLAIPVILCVFTKYRFPLVWSIVVFLSYSAYSNGAFQENIWLIAIEYVVVFGFLSWEIFRRKNLRGKDSEYELIA